jgi:hypothetical protein|tara:strand:- start:255 stop:506 length:252 start_codon:yes stop_codon:yes gene_type:complete
MEILSMYKLLKESIGTRPQIRIDESFDYKETAITISLWHKGQRHYSQFGVSFEEEGTAKASFLGMKITAHIEELHEYLKGLGE